MVQRRNIVVFVLCTAFVLGFYAVLNYEAGGVQLSSLQSKGPALPCDLGGVCQSFNLVSASLVTANFTDELGPAGYSNLTMVISVAGNATVQSFDVYIGGTKVGSLAGPFGPGTVRTFKFTLPSTDTITPGMTYIVSVDGFVGQSGTSATAAWKTLSVTAR